MPRVISVIRLIERVHRGKETFSGFNAIEGRSGKGCLACAGMCCHPQEGARAVPVTRAVCPHLTCAFTELCFTCVWVEQELVFSSCRNVPGERGMMRKASVASLVLVFGEKTPRLCHRNVPSLGGGCAHFNTTKKP